MLLIAPALAFLLLVLPGCSSLRYEPAHELRFSSVVERGCGEEGDRVTTHAQINRVYRDSLILWNGRDSDSTYTVKLVEPSFGQRARAKIGTSRLERAYEVLEELEAARIPIEIAFTCAKGDRPPTANRFSYMTDRGERRTFELGDRK